jgi:Ca2+-binding EF-hand superfamily protein
MTWWDNEGPSKGLKLGDKELQKRVEAAAMFKNYDTDGSGAVSKEEFSAMHQEMQRRGYTAKPVDAVLAEIDEDRDGEVQFNEYINWLIKSGILSK